MANVFIDNIVTFNQYDLKQDEDIFQRILEERKDKPDNKRFYLKYITAEDLSKYNFEDEKSLREFRSACVSFDSPLKGMGGCNLREDELEKGILYSGIQLSDPYGKIPGIFYVNNNIITYSPILSLFYEQRDISKFASATYFTSIPFEEIIMTQLNNVEKFLVHTGDYWRLADIKKYGTLKLEEVDKTQMIQFATNPEEGEKIFLKTI